MKKIATALVVSSFLILSPASVLAAPCKDAKGKFIKCPPKAAAAPAKAARCRDAKGHFMKCK
jgi:hypothetical protein